MYKQSLQKETITEAKPKIVIDDTNWHITSKLSMATNPPKENSKQYVKNIVLSGCLMNMYDELKESYMPFGFMDTSDAASFVKLVSAQIVIQERADSWYNEGEDNFDE